MFTNSPHLKVLAFGTQLMLRRLSAKVDKYEIEITSCSEAAEAAAKLGSQEFDVVIVDHFVKDADQICRNAVNITHVPVAVMMQEKFADWKALRRLEADGYIPDDKGSEELMARIRAYSRRRRVVHPV